MTRLTNDSSTLEALLQPETMLERTLLTVPAFRQGLLWGEPRFGHPEGQVALHVREVLDNIDLITALSESQRAQLRLIALSHDTFKFAEVRGKPRDWSKHHGRLAQQFMYVHTSDRVVLDVLETHDDAYYAWLSTRQPVFAHENPQKNLENLLERMSYCLQLYYLFFKCDTQTGDKTQASLKWFERTVPGIAIVRIRAERDNDEPVL